MPKRTLMTLKTGCHSLRTRHCYRGLCDSRLKLSRLDRVKSNLNKSASLKTCGKQDPLRTLRTSKSKSKSRSKTQCSSDTETLNSTKKYSNLLSSLKQTMTGNSRNPRPNETSRCAGSAIFQTSEWHTLCSLTRETMSAWSLATSSS